MEHRRVTTLMQILVVVGIGRQWDQFVMSVVHIFLLGALGVLVVQLLLLELEPELAVRIVEQITVRE